MSASLSSGRNYSVSRQEKISFYLMVAPWLIGFLVFQVYIFGSGLIAGFTNLGSPFTHFVGLKNYIRILTQDQFFWVAVVSTLQYAVLTTLLSAVIGLGVAVLLNQKIKGLSIYRTIFYLPVVVPVVSATLTWAFIYDRDFGLLNAGLRLMGIRPITWLMDPNLIWSLIIMSVWSTVGATMIVLLAGLQGVPTELLESSAIDGAGPFRRFINVTLPLITPALFFNIVTGLIGSMQMFSQAELIHRGGSSAGAIGAINVFQKGNFVLMRDLTNAAFTETRIGYACALSWILFIAITLISVIVFATSKYWVYYESIAGEGGERK